ncbi:phage protein HK97 gp10 family [Clostridium sp. CAG:470]|nr:phage protein HK97 gp10 family [Clostridium sp. CAG:470]
MSNETYKFDGFQDLENILENYADKVNNFVDVLKTGAKEFVNDLIKLPKPMSKVRKAGYTHLVRSFAYKINKNEVEVGWGKYYGPMVEHGTKKMDENPHVYPLWNKNKEKYYKNMLAKLWL